MDKAYDALKKGQKIYKRIEKRLSKKIEIPRDTIELGRRVADSLTILNTTRHYARLASQKKVV